jgi:hypothetical protein
MDKLDVVKQTNSRLLYDTRAIDSSRVKGPQQVPIQDSRSIIVTQTPYIISTILVAIFHH